MISYVICIHHSYCLLLLLIMNWMIYLHCTHMHIYIHIHSFSLFIPIVKIIDSWYFIFICKSIRMLFWCFLCEFRCFQRNDNRTIIKWIIHSFSHYIALFFLSTEFSVIHLNECRTPIIIIIVEVRAKNILSQNDCACANPHPTPITNTILLVH